MSRTRGAFATPAFRLLWTGRFVALLGTGAAAVTLQLMVVDRGGPTAVALLFLSLAVPQIAAPLYAHLVRRRDPCRTMIAADLVQGGLVATIAFLLPRGPLLYCLLALTGTAATFFFVAGRTLLNEVLDRDAVPSGVAWLALAGNAQNSVGPLVGAVLLAVAGPRPALLVTAASFLASATLLSILSARRPLVRVAASSGSARPPGTHSDTDRAGPHQLWSAAHRPSFRRLTHGGLGGDRMLATVIATGIIGAFAGAVLNVALVVRLRQDLQFDELRFGTAMAAFGLGAVAATPLYQRLGQYGAVARLRLALAGVGASCLLLAVIDSPASVSVVLVLAGLAQATTYIARENVVQDRALERIGPAGALLTSGTSVGLILGFVVAGGWTTLVGSQWALSSAAILVLVSVVLCFPTGSGAARPRLPVP